ncbi:sodium ion channel, putative [Bodo saltans]|uniref:Sodium ion channel, putative n=1 Tax=Bodo saltans TaxID=75058 RepID=A0A0S4JAS2_BODSA|nr:sodium ion channel, putative [Bodo saltans]|eukprot:CUG88615.1 sodium ion channel, putative [Bodo saltans]
MDLQTCFLNHFFFVSEKIAHLAMVGKQDPLPHVVNQQNASFSTVDIKSPQLRMDRSGNRGHSGSATVAASTVYHPRVKSASSDVLSNDSFGLGLPDINFQRSSDVQERRIRALEDQLQSMNMKLVKGARKGKVGKKTSESADKEKKTISLTSPLQLLRYFFIGVLIALTIYVTVFLWQQWLDSGSQPSVTFTLASADTLAMPTAGMIPAPYATDTRCFNPRPLYCTAYTGEVLQRDCMSWLSVVSTSFRPGAAARNIWAIDGVKATNDGYVFHSILDYIEYSFVFPDDCSEPYLWVYVSGDTRIVTEAQMDPNISMREYAQTSFLIQGGQYVMVAFSMLQDIDLNNDVTNTTTISVSSMMVSAFNASLNKTATAVFRPGSFRIQTTTAQPGMTFLEFLANLGGWIGLFLGFSVMQFVDFGEFLHSYFCEPKVEEPISDLDDDIEELSPEDK